MYKSVIIISLTILALPAIFGCGDKSTDLGIGYDRDRVNLTINVRRLDTMPVIEADIELRPCPIIYSRYDCMVQKGGFITCGETDYAGRFELYPEKKNKYDTMSVFVSKPGYHSDSLEFILTYSEENVNINILLYEDTLNPPPEPNPFIFLLIWVSDIQNDPIPGADVRLWNDLSPRPQHRVTNSNGFCRFWPDVDPPNDTIWLTAAKDEFKTDTSFIVVYAAGQILYHYIILRPELEGISSL
ncbi:MAG: carboxypeptidase-like regulatory domain-containing protein [Candidatus Zixiibacteriota bacterium]